MLPFRKGQARTYRGDSVATPFQAIPLARVQVVQRHISVRALCKLESGVVKGLGTATPQDLP